MKVSQIVKSILFSVVYSTNLFLAWLLWLAGQDGNIMLGILLIVFYRLSLWFTPLIVTVICWLPLRPKVPAKIKILANLVHLGFCAVLYVICFHLFGNWF